jgi:hypothetical protein
VQQALAHAAREHAPEALAVGRAEHDHVGALALGELGQHEGRGRPAERSQLERRLAEDLARGGREALLGLGDGPLVGVRGRRKGVVFERRDEYERRALDRRQAAGERERVLRPGAGVVTDQDSSIHRAGRLGAARIACDEGRDSP